MCSYFSVYSFHRRRDIFALLFFRLFVEQCTLCVEFKLHFLQQFFLGPFVSLRSFHRFRRFRPKAPQKSFAFSRVFYTANVANSAEKCQNVAKRAKTSLGLARAFSFFFVRHTDSHSHSLRSLTSFDHFVRSNVSSDVVDSLTSFVRLLVRSLLTHFLTSFE